MPALYRRAPSRQPPEPKGGSGRTDRHHRLPTGNDSNRIGNHHSIRGGVRSLNVLDPEGRIGSAGPALDRVNLDQVFIMRLQHLRNADMKIVLPLRAPLAQFRKFNFGGVTAIGTLQLGGARFKLELGATILAGDALRLLPSAVILAVRTQLDPGHRGKLHELAAVGTMIG